MNDLEDVIGQTFFLTTMSFHHI